MQKTTLEKGIYYLECLPEKEQTEAVELLRKLVIAWDPDYTKLTKKEKARLDEMDNNISEDDYINENNINWDD